MVFTLHWSQPSRLPKTLKGLPFPETVLANGSRCRTEGMAWCSWSSRKPCSSKGTSAIEEPKAGRKPWPKAGPKGRESGWYFAWVRLFFCFVLFCSRIFAANKGSDDDDDEEEEEDDDDDGSVGRTLLRIQIKPKGWNTRAYFGHLFSIWFNQEDWCFLTGSSCPATHFSIWYDILFFNYIQ